MAFSPAFQFYPNDWLGSSKVMMMTPAEEGAYIRLLAIAWGEADGGLPIDDDTLAVLSRLGNSWLRSKEKILRCFFEKDGRYFNKRLLAERKKQTAKREQASNAALKRWNANVLHTHSGSNANAEETQCTSIEEEIENRSSSLSPEEECREETALSLPGTSQAAFREWLQAGPMKWLNYEVPAWRQWKLLMAEPNAPLVTDLIEGAKRYKAYLKDSGFVKNPENWLIAGMWSVNYEDVAKTPEERKKIAADEKTARILKTFGVEP